MIFRVEKTSDYTVMSNYHLRQAGMTLKAKGLLSLILSLPDTWDYSIAGLVAICKESESAVKSTLKELKQFGYLEIIKITPDRTSSGRYEYEYVIYEKPRQAGKKQEGENQPVEIQAVENHRQLSTNRSSTDGSSTDEIINYLNQRTGRRYRSTDKTRHLINARMKEGFTVDDFKAVIDKKSAEWLNDSKMNIYLRPDTLFGNKFQGYLNQNVKSRNPFKERLGGAV